MNLGKNDDNLAKGTEVKEGRDGTFLEKPDIVDKYSRRILDPPELIELYPTIWQDVQTCSLQEE